MNKKSEPVVFFAGGGTSGHINPAIAIADTLRAGYPDARIIFCGTEHGLENDIVPRTGYAFETIRASGFPRKLNRKLVGAVRDFRAGKKRALELIDAYRPDAVVGTGGYVCGPVLAAAKSAGVPILIHEQNAFPGQSNRVMSKGADVVCISFEQTRPYFRKAHKVVLTGNPVREEFWRIGRRAARGQLGIADDCRFLLATGGSRGARAINQAVLSFMKLNQDLDARVLLACGRDLYEETIAAAKDMESDRFEIREYLYDMPLYMAAADMLICRAGAITCAEIAALSKAAIFVPYPYASDDHQTHNAKAYSDIGAGLLCPNNQLTGEWLTEQVPPLLFDDRRRGEMESKAGSLAMPDAVDEIFKELENLF